MSAAIRPGDVLAEAARLGVSIRPGGAPGKLKLTGPAESVQRLTPLVAQHKAELLEMLTERQTAPELPREFCDRRDPANDAETALMLERAEVFERMGLTPGEVDLAVERLLRRDRGLDDRHLCIECQHVRADRVGWRCAALRGLIPSEWVARQLQRCPTFKGAEHD
jgi:hypothetical protein